MMNCVAETTEHNIYFPLNTVISALKKRVVDSVVKIFLQLISH